MHRSLATSLPRGVQRVSTRKCCTLISQKYAMLTEPGTYRRSGVKDAKVQCFHSGIAKQSMEIKSWRPSPVMNPSDWPDPLWLRDACHCELCVDPSSKQKRFQTSDIPLDVSYIIKEFSPDGALSVSWSNDIQGFGSNHISTYSQDFLSLANTALTEHQKTIFSRASPKLWAKAGIAAAVKFIDFNEYVSQDSVVHDVLNQLHEYGLVFLRNVPESEKSIEKIAGRIGPLKNTFYGLTWDVKSIPDAKNVAYTHQYLGLHMDLLYTSEPPALQLLHCLKNTCEGGTSLFCDSFKAAVQLRFENNEAFNQLLNQRTTFVYDNAGQSYERSRNVITQRGGRVIGVNWSPPFQGPFPITGGIGNRTGWSEFRSYIAALKEFAARIESPKNVYEYRLEEGECVIFNNRRVLHARKAFDINSGERWLKGAYIDSDVWNSRKVLLDRSFGAQP